MVKIFQEQIQAAGLWPSDTLRYLKAQAVFANFKSLDGGGVSGVK